MLDGELPRCILRVAKLPRMSAEVVAQVALLHPHVPKRLVMRHRQRLQRILRHPLRQVARRNARPFQPVPQFSGKCGHS